MGLPNLRLISLPQPEGRKEVAQHLQSRGVELEIIDDPACRTMMKEFIAARPELWSEDIGK